jgi:cation diffusion facilitator CzcD-associated flavoprotein CzcO
MTETALTNHHHVAIIGTGFGGLAAAIQLKRAGVGDLVILEKAGDVGGVWRDNSYPGCACDVQSHLYSYSYAPNSGWEHMFSRQPEIWAYLRRCASEFDLNRNIRFNTAVEQLLWMEDEQRWAITTSTGILSAAHVVLATGALSEPQIPELPGLDDFEGAVFHSARWDHGFDLEGKRVAVVGTGASAIQFVPAIQPRVGQLTLFQRTAPWVMPRHDRPITDGERARFGSFPITQRLQRWKIYLEREQTVLGFRHPGLMKLAERQARRHLARQVSDPELRRKLTPDYRLGCKRILISNDYLKSLNQPNAEMVTSGIREVRARSVVDDDGVEHEVDAIIFGTGFRTQSLPLTEFTYGASYQGNWRDVVLFLCAVLFTVVWWNINHSRTNWLPMFIVLIVLSILTAVYAARGLTRAGAGLMRAQRRDRHRT